MAWIPVRPIPPLILFRADDRLPLITISIVRTISFTMYTSTKRILNSSPTPTTSSTRKGKEKEVEAPWVDLKLGMFKGNSAKDVAVTSLLAGGASGAVVCVGSAPFELVKVRLPASANPHLSSVARGSIRWMG